MVLSFKDKSGTFNEHLTRITPSVSSVFPMHAQAQKNLKVECPFSWSTMCFTRAFHSSELGSHLMKASSIHITQFWPCKSFKIWRTSLGDSWFLVSEGSIMVSTNTLAHLSLCNFHRSQQRQAAAMPIQKVPYHARQICGTAATAHSHRIRKAKKHQIASRNFICFFQSMSLTMTMSRNRLFVHSWYVTIGVYIL